jgi:hypothetical protein
MLYDACPPKKFHCRQTLCDLEKGVIVLQEIYQLQRKMRKMRDVRAERAYPFSFFDLGFAKLPVDSRS